MSDCNSQNVVLKMCTEYSTSVLTQKIESILPYLDLPVTLNGATVLLKPNLISSRGPSLACTHPEFILAVARILIDHGAKIKIGDSPALGTTRSVMARHGMLEKLKTVPFELVQFKTPVPQTVGTGLNVQIAAEALECDLLVNLPKLKAHNQMYLTCAVKNFFGVIVGARKVMLHMRHGKHTEFSDILLSIPDIFPSHISLVDGVEVMHKSGPLDGESLPLKLVGGANCPVAMDTSLLQILELPFTCSPLWEAAVRRQHKGSDVSKITFPEMVPEEFWGSGFAAPESLNPIRFSIFRVMSSVMRRIRLAINQ